MTSGLEKTNWQIRKARGDDLSFIYATWLLSYWKHSQSHTATLKEVFYKEYPPILDQILAHPKTQVLVACAQFDDSIIFGYLVTTDRVTHYCYVKADFRRFGIGGELYTLSQGNGVYTHFTSVLSHILKNHPALIYNPYLLFKQKEESYVQAHSKISH